MRDETKIDKITNIVRDKTVILCGNSPTLSFLVRNREILHNDKISLCAVNKWTGIEKDLHRPMDIVCLGRNLIESHNVEFSFRGNNLMIPVVSSMRTSRYKQQTKDRIEFLSKCDADSVAIAYTNKQDGPHRKKKLQFFRLDTPQMLCLCVMYGKPKNIFMFGCDNGPMGITKDFEEADKKFSHYGHRINNFCAYYKSTDLMNNKMRVAMGRMANLFGIEIPTYIIGLHSGYDFTERITKEHALDMIVRGT